MNGSPAAGQQTPTESGAREIDEGPEPPSVVPKSQTGDRSGTRDVLNELPFVAPEADAVCCGFELKRADHETARGHRAIVVLDADHEIRRDTLRAQVGRPLPVQLLGQGGRQPLEAETQARDIDVDRLSGHAVPALAVR